MTKLESVTLSYPDVVKNLRAPSAAAKKINLRFVELLGRSNFSFLQGASHAEEMVEQAILHDYKGISICDLDGFYGIARGYQAYKNPSHFVASADVNKDFKYLIGSEVTFTDHNPIVLMPLNKKGYVDLCTILTLGKRQAAKGHSRLKLSDIKNKTDDLLAFPIPPWTAEGIETLQEIFADRLYVPVWRDLTWESLQFCKQAFQLESEKGVSLFVSQRPFMHTPDRKPLFDVMTCILHGKKLRECGDILVQNKERHLKDLNSLYELWKDRPDLLEKSWEIANRVNFSLSEIRYRYPRSNMPEGANATTYLKTLVEKGLEERYPEGVSDKVRKQIKSELALIADLEYEDYFLTLKEICLFAKEKNILFQGRGSAANSVVCFALGLTAVDPMKFDLLFERFLSKERGEPPDIDIDFEHERREEVIQHIYQKYGEQHAAMVCTVIRYKTRMSFRETAKVFGVPLEHINKMVKYMGREGIKKLVEDPEYVKQFGLEFKEFQRITNLARELHGFPRHLGIHTGGFLITQDPMIEIVPVEKATMESRYVIQWNKDDVATLGLMKIDVLSLGMLSCLRKCLDLLKNHKNINFNLATIPEDDPKTYAMIQKADTVGVFQIESRAQMATLPRLKPKNFYDLVVEVAIVRPGPLQGGMVHPYLRRRAGLEKVEYAHSSLEEILHKTMGVPIFQEQIMKMVVAVANFSAGEADELRRIMAASWRKKAVIDGLRIRMMRGLKANGLTDEYAEQVYKTIEGFASYGFPESHAASFALLTYASCYLKNHHPDVFLCAILNSQPMGFYSPRSLIQDAQKHGVQMLPLDIQKSDYDYSLEGPEENSHHKVRLGLRSIYGINAEALKKIELERRKESFSSIEDFIKRTDLPRSALMKLASSGAFACFNTNARELLWYLQSVSLDQKSFLWGKPMEGFDSKIENQNTNYDFLPRETQWQTMEREYQTKGYSLTLHPISVLRSWIEEKNDHFLQNKFVLYCKSKNLNKVRHKGKVRVAGLLSMTQKPPTAKGFCFLTLEDEFGIFNIVVPPKVYDQYRDTIYAHSLLEIQGHLENVSTVINIKAEKVLPLVRKPLQKMLLPEPGHTSINR